MRPITIIAEVRPDAAAPTRIAEATCMFRARDAHRAHPDDLIELEEDDDPALVETHRRVLGLRIAAGESDDAVERLLTTPARFYHVVYEAETHADTLRPLRLLQKLQRQDVIAYAAGTIGMWTRAAAPQLGAPAVVGTLDGDIATHGVPNVRRLIDDYGFPNVHHARELFGIAGDPIFGSLSPRLHNAAFRELNRHALYVPFHVRDFDDFWSGLVAGAPTDALGLPLRALCVVSPHKAVALDSASSATALVARTRSSNFFVRGASGWVADTTDAAGLLLALADSGVDVTTLKAAVVGCGGSGRTIAAALQQAGADVTLVNRGPDRASLAVRLLRLPFRPLANFSPSGYSLVVNATPLGGQGEPPPFAIGELDRDAIVVDLVYGQRPTPLVAATRGNGRVVIDGKDILVKQAMRQFHLMTGQEMPPAIAPRVLTPVA
ncbi:MAG TPA: type I 3-dehydroquinate dehydratase [Thermoanaerobaculia bacterium]|nr:type I 3-dehydroquinate dehydratase [Thermoanaerobaculia bacterium]